MENMLEWLVTPVINIGAILIVLIGFWKQWALSKGASRLRKVYWLQIINCILSFTVYSLIATKHTDVWGLLTLIPLIVWSFIMSIKGLLYADVSCRKHMDNRIVSSE